MSLNPTYVVRFWCSGIGLVGIPDSGRSTDETYPLTPFLRGRGNSSPVNDIRMPVSYMR